MRAASCASDGNPVIDPPPEPFDAAAAADVRALSLVSGLGRMAIGVGLALAPERALGALGFEDPSPAILVVSRLAGGRDLVLGALTLAALDDPVQLRRASLASAAIDAGDAATFAAALASRDGAVKDAGIRGLGAALVAAVAGLWVVRRLRGAGRPAP